MKVTIPNQSAEAPWPEPLSGHWRVAVRARRLARAPEPQSALEALRPPARRTSAFQWKQFPILLPVRLLHCHAMQRTQAEDQIAAIDADHLA